MRSPWVIGLRSWWAQTGYTVHPADQKQAVEAYEEMIINGKGEFEARAVCKNNSEFYKHVLMVKRFDEKAISLGIIVLCET